MCKMKWALVVMVLSLHVSSALAADGSRPAREATGDQGKVMGFDVWFVENTKKAGLERHRELLVRGVAYRLIIRARDAMHNGLPDFAGQAEVEGLFTLGEEGNRKSIGRTVQFKDGRAVLSGVYLSADTVTVRRGPVVETVTPRTIPGWLTVVPPLCSQRGG